MKTPREIYAEFNIMPSLQLHQLRVAAVGKLICDNFKEPIDTGTVVLTCLFHDMGNILKFDFSQFPQFLEPEGLNFWQSVKDDYASRYGGDEHHATEAIADELKLPREVLQNIKGIGFSKLERIVHSSFELQICEYADLRVGPYGILSLQERIDEGRKRYSAREDKRHVMSRNDGRFEILSRETGHIEESIFSRTNITPDGINDATIAPITEELWEYPVS